jgi:cell wall-associated NlpC family hydrolase
MLPPRPCTTAFSSAWRALLLGTLLATLAACSSVRPPPPSSGPAPQSSAPTAAPSHHFHLQDETHAREIVLYALGLIDVGYRFGGRNPEAGLDCSGMVSYIVEQVSGQRLPHNAAQIASRTRPISVSELRAGDLVFFNTLNRRHSHMGVYIGDGRFIHAPSSRGRIRIERLDNPYFSQRIDGARSLLAASR